MERPLLTTTHSRHRIGHSFIAGGLFLFLVFSLLLSTVSSQPAVAFGSSTILDMTNLARKENGLKTLKLNESLSRAAQAKAEAMVQDNYFDHTAPDNTTGWDFIDETNYKYISAGENLAASNEDDLSVVSGWLESPSHRANLLSEAYDEIGLGIAYKGSYQTYQNVSYVVALYAQPTTSRVVPLSTSLTSPTIDSGIEVLSKDYFEINKNLGITIFATASFLLILGMSIEINHLRKHVKSARPLSRPGHA